MVGREARLRVCPPWLWFPVGAKQGGFILSLGHTALGRKRLGWGLGVA